MEEKGLPAVAPQLTDNIHDLTEPIDTTTS